MRVTGIVVIHRDPFELGSQVLLHASHKITHEGLQVRHAGAVLGRNDEPELVAIAFLTSEEVTAIGTIVLPVVKPPRLTIGRNGVALDVALVGPSRAEV